MSKHGGQGRKGKGGGEPKSLSYSPDYQTLLEQDPAYSALKQQISAQQIQDAATRQAATDQALIQFGMIPDFSSLGSTMGLSPQAIQMLQQDISPQVAALAHQNTAGGLSTEALLQQNQADAIRNLRNNLAARGGLSSGEDAFQTQRQDQNYALAQNNALQKLLSAIGGYQQNYLTNQQTEQQQLAQGLSQAETNQSALTQNQGFNLSYNPRTGKYHSSAGGSYSVGHSPHGMTLTSDQTGASYLVGPNGALTAQ